MTARKYLRIGNIVQYIKDNVTEPINNIRITADNGKFTQYYEYDFTSKEGQDKLTKDYNHLADQGYKIGFLPLD